MGFAGLLAALNPFDDEEQVPFLSPEDDPRLQRPASQPVAPGLVEERPRAPEPHRPETFVPTMPHPSAGDVAGGLLGKLGRYVTSPEGMLAIGTTLRSASNPNAFADQRAIMGSLNARRKDAEDRADQKLKNDAFNAGIEVDEKTGRTKYNAQKSAQFYQEHGGRGDLASLVKGVKDMRDKYDITEGQDGSRIAVNSYEPTDKSVVVGGQRTIKGPHGETIILTQDGATAGPAPAGPAPATAATAPTTGAPVPPPPPPPTPQEEAAAAGPADLAATHAREGSGQNPYSSAFGHGQFIEGTWLQTMKGDPQFANDIAGKTNAQILALRADQGIADRAIQSYAVQNTPMLEAGGVEPTQANLGMAHGYGPKAAIRIARAPPNTPIEAIIGRHTAQINRVAGMTTGQVQGEFTRRFGVRQIADAGPQGSDAAARAAAQPAAEPEPGFTPPPGWRVESVIPAGQTKPLTPQQYEALIAGGGITRDPTGEMKQIVDPAKLEAERAKAKAGPKPPAKLATTYADNKGVLAKIELARQAIARNPEAFGGQNVADKLSVMGVPAGEMWMNSQRSPNQVSALASVADVGSALRHARTGAAQTASEVPFLKPFVPNPWDDAKTTLAKLGQMEAALLADNGELTKLYPGLATGAGVEEEVAAGAVQVESAEEARALPPGTVFITPDGRQKVR